MAVYLFKVGEREREREERRRERERGESTVCKHAQPPVYAGYKMSLGAVSGYSDYSKTVSCSQDNWKRLLLRMYLWTASKASSLTATGRVSFPSIKSCVVTLP